MSAEPPALPKALDDDDDDVAWALQTAGVQWERGGADDAVVWLRRAAEAAVEAGAFGRSADIQRRANEIDRWLKQSVTFPVQNDDDDGVDSLLATDTGEVEVEVETGAISEPSQSLVDALEAEADDYADAPVVEEAPVQDLGDVEDVEDIEAVDLEEVEESRKLDGYREELLDETTHARSEVSRSLLTEVQKSTLPPPGSQRPPASQRAPGSQRATGRVLTQPPSSRPGKPREVTRVSAPPPRDTARVSVPPPKPYVSSLRPGSARSSSAPRELRRSLNATPQVPPPPEYKLPPPPIPRLPLPEPRPSARPLPPVSEPRSTFPSEPATLPASERPFRSQVVEVTRSDEPPRVEMPTRVDELAPAHEAPRQRVESLPEVSATELDQPEDAPTSKYTLGSADEGTTASLGLRTAARASTVPGRGAVREPPVSIAAPAELDAAVDALSETPPPPPLLDVALLAACRGLEDLPVETQAELALRARLEVLAPDQEVSGFGLALVTRGNVVVMPTIAEGACGYASRGEPVFSQGTLSEGVPLRVVALADGAEVAVWRPEDFENVLETCPWVADELRAVADRFQALAGAAMGPLGDRLDDNMRQMLTDRCDLRVLLAGDVIIEQGKAPDGLFIVGGGKLELVVGGKVRQELGPGDLPFAASVLTHEKASGTVRAAATGALVLHANRMATHELIVSVPPLLELLSMV
jgi:hypothetical protein